VTKLKLKDEHSPEKEAANAAYIKATSKQTDTVGKYFTDQFNHTKTVIAVIY
jgi:hypothetical protein